MKWGPGAPDRARVALRARGPARRRSRRPTACASTATRSSGTDQLAGLARRRRSPGARLARALAAHVETLVGRYAGRVAAWDVVNEAVADRRRLRDTDFLRALGAGLPRGGLPAGPRRRSRRPALLQRLRRRGAAARSRTRCTRSSGGSSTRASRSTASGSRCTSAATHPPEPGRHRGQRRAARRRSASRSGSRRWTCGSGRVRRRRSPGRPAPRVPRRDRRVRGAAGLRGRDVLGRERRATPGSTPAFGEDDPLLFDRDYAPKPAYFGARDALAAGQKATAQSIPSVQPENESDQK